jgi:uncharacterized RDD family membrane protein YckC
MNWYYAIENDRRGPVSQAEFEVLVSNGTIRPDALVWREGMADWVPYRALARGGADIVPGTGMRYAGFWIRFVAKLVDSLILGLAGFVFGLVVGFVFALTLGDGGDTAATMVVYLFGIVISCLYFVMFVGAKGATPGKMLLGLKVVRADGSRVSYGLALGRWFAAALNYFTLYIGWFLAGWTREKCGLHDFICDTRVIHTR